MPVAFFFGLGIIRFMAKAIDVKKLRTRLNLTQQEMGARLAVDQSTVHKLEAGKMTPSKPVQRLLEQLYATRET